MITAKGECRHRNGNWLDRCFYNPVYRHSECRSLCTTSNSCIGYIYECRAPSCELIVTRSWCPNGWRYYSGNHYTMAKTSNDLVAFPRPNYDITCHAKNEGTPITQVLNQYFHRAFFHSPISLNLIFFESLDFLHFQS